MFENWFKNKLLVLIVSVSIGIAVNRVLEIGNFISKILI